MTLNQTVARLQSLALSHKQIKYFDYDNIIEVLTKGKITYPACFIDHANTVVSKKDHQTKHKFTIWFCDLVNVSEDARNNVHDVESDLTSIAEDYIAMINSTLFQNSWTINDEYQLNYYKEKFEELVGAVSFDIEIGVDFLSDRCQVPDNTPNLYLES